MNFKWNFGRVFTCFGEGYSRCEWKSKNFLTSGGIIFYNAIWYPMFYLHHLRGNT